MNLFDERDFKISLSAIEQYINDLSKNYDKKTLNKVMRSSFKNGEKLLLAAEKKLLEPYIASRGKLNKYGIAHSGLLKSGLKGRIKRRDTRVSLIVGVRNVKKSEKVIAGRLRYIRAPTYGGVWLNYGTQAHNIGKSTRMRSRRYKGSTVAGIQGTDWVMKSYRQVEQQLIQTIERDISRAYDESVQNTYKSK